MTATFLHCTTATVTVLGIVQESLSLPPASSEKSSVETLAVPKASQRIHSHKSSTTSSSSAFSEHFQLEASETVAGWDDRFTLKPLGGQLEDKGKSAPRTATLHSRRSSDSSAPFRFGHRARRSDSIASASTAASSQLASRPSHTGSRPFLDASYEPKSIFVSRKTKRRPISDLFSRFLRPSSSIKANQSLSSHDILNAALASAARAPQWGAPRNSSRSIFDESLRTRTRTTTIDSEELGSTLGSPLGGDCSFPIPPGRRPSASMTSRSVKVGGRM